MATAFRSIPVDSPEAALPGTTRPAGFGPADPRPGSAAAIEWFAVYIDANGDAMIGGSATVAWYGVTFDGSILTPAIGAAVVTNTLDTHKIEIGQGVWPWCRVTAMTPPAVAAKSIRVSVGGDGDGEYSIQVDATTAVAYTKLLGDTATDIRDGLLAAFAAHPTASAATDAVPEDLVVTALAAGVDFELTLVSPGDVLTQAEETPVVAVPAILRVYTAQATPSGIDDTALAGRVASEVAAPTAAEVATEVGAQAACAAAIAVAALATTAGMAPVVAAAAEMTATEFSHLGADSEVEAVAAVPGYTIVVWGYEAYQFSPTSSVGWRLSSGVEIEDVGNVDVTIFSKIAPLAGRIFPPAGRGLFVGEPSRAIFSKKDTGVDITGTVWWTTVQNP